MHDATSLSRRQLLRAAAVGAGLGAFGLGRLAVATDGEGGAAAPPDSTTTTTTVPTPNDQALDDAGNALSTATRLGVEEPDVPVTPAPLVEPAPEGKLIFPIAGPASDCYVLDNYGDCRGNACSRLHEGVDIMGSRGQNLIAVANGVLTKRYVDSGLSYGAGNGWTLYDEENDVYYKYFHMGTHAEGLEEGDTVVLGQVIGTVGNTGTSGVSTDSNYHLHFEVRPGNSPIDPLPLLVVDESICGISPPIKA